MIAGRIEKGNASGALLAEARHLRRLSHVADASQKGESAQLTILVPAVDESPRHL
jgi:hypothetical protein